MYKYFFTFEFSLSVASKIIILAEITVKIRRKLCVCGETDVEFVIRDLDLVEIAQLLHRQNGSKEP